MIIYINRANYNVKLNKQNKTINITILNQIDNLDEFIYDLDYFLQELLDDDFKSVVIIIIENEMAEKTNLEIIDFKNKYDYRSFNIFNIYDILQYKKIIIRTNQKDFQECFLNTISSF